MLDFNKDHPDGMPDFLEFDYLVGGSYVVNPSTAGDIDLYVHEYNEPPDSWLIRNEWRRLSEGDDKYPEIDNQRLKCVYEKINKEGFKLNLIVVGCFYWPAYVGAIAAMTARPDLYQTRDARIELHKNYCKQIKDIVEGH